MFLKQIHKFCSFLLLLGIGLSLHPFEALHHHDQPSVICKESNQHIEEPFFDCDLCDFVLPVTESQSLLTFQFSLLEGEVLLSSYIQKKSFSNYNTTPGRSPPYTA